MSDHDLALPPGERVLRLVSRLGEPTVAEWCAALLTGAVAADDAGAPALAWLGGRHGQHHLRRLGRRPDQEYWPRVWAARGLLYVWTESAGPAVAGALQDGAWRVREMAARVARRRELGDAGDRLLQCLDDPVPRVRAAAARALGRIADADSVPHLRARLRDPDPAVRVSAGAALRELSTRIDR